MASKKNGALVGAPTALAPVSNGAAFDITLSEPYAVEVTVRGTTAFLFHAWNVEAVEERGNAAKGSKGRKTDNLESYVYRTENGELAIPSEYLRMAVIQAAKYRQDPRSPRKSAMDLFKAAILPLDEFCSLGTKDWDYLDRRRVMVQRNGITRVRPAMVPGWQITARLEVLVPEYVDRDSLHATLTQAGRLVGIGDFRPTFGRFQVTRFEVIR